MSNRNHRGNPAGESSTRITDIDVAPTYYHDLKSRAWFLCLAAIAVITRDWVLVSVRLPLPSTLTSMPPTSSNSIFLPAKLDIKIR
jgi:hypothetical protein